MKKRTITIIASIIIIILLGLLFFKYTQDTPAPNSDDSLNAQASFVQQQGLKDKIKLAKYQNKDKSFIGSVHTPYGQGTGFAINAHTFITAGHVVETPKQHKNVKTNDITFKLNRTSNTDGTLIHANKVDRLNQKMKHGSTDIAVIHTNEAMHAKHFAQLPQQNQAMHLKDKDRIYSIGYPKGHRNNFKRFQSTGFITHVNNTAYPEMIVTLPILSGQSGSPIFTQDDTLIGLVTTTYYYSKQDRNQKVRQSAIGMNTVFDKATLKWINKHAN